MTIADFNKQCLDKTFKLLVKNLLHQLTKIFVRAKTARKVINSSYDLISKVYFPRLIAPTSVVIVSFVDFSSSGMILLALMAWYNFVPDWRIFMLPFFILIAFAVAIGAGLWFAALNVEYRDFRYVVPFWHLVFPQDVMYVC